MEELMFRRSSLLVVVCVACLVVAGCGGGGGGGGDQKGSSKNATLEVWLGGILATATPGTPFRKWVDEQTRLFKSQNPGVKVHVTLLPSDNGQLAAKVQAAFTARSVPDVMMLYAGAYTTAYQSGLAELNKYITPSFYGSLTGWPLGCVNFDCKDGKGQIIGVPFDVATFAVYYNKALFRKAGLTAPAKTYNELYQQCAALKAKGILPMVYGDQEGYATSNMLTSNLVSYLGPGDLGKLLNRQLKFSDPQVSQALAAVDGLRTHGCVNDDHASMPQLNSYNKFAAGDAAMVEGYAQNLPQLKEALGSKLGVTVMPVSGTGPWKDRQAANAGENWVIPKGAKNADLAWKWIALAAGAKMQLLQVKYLGAPPANREAAGHIEDPFVKFFADATSDPALPELDQAIPNRVALTMYRELSQQFSGAPLAKTMNAIDQAYEQSAP
jgi:ABC-type glycerol-3-phosphate transport system substrate-binding protein